MDRLLIIHSLDIEKAGTNHPPLSYQTLPTLEGEPPVRHIRLMNSDASFFMVPALDGLSRNEITVLNRPVTANYCEAESKDGIALDALYPVSRQKVLMLSSDKGGWDCDEVTQVWTAGMNSQLNLESSCVRTGRRIRLVSLAACPQN